MGKLVLHLVNLFGLYGAHSLRHRLDFRIGYSRQILVDHRKCLLMVPDHILAKCAVIGGSAEHLQGVGHRLMFRHNLRIVGVVEFLAGVAAETGVIMLIYLDHAYRDHIHAGQMRSISDLHAAIEYGAVERVRPKTMTVVAIVAGLLPLLWSQDVGADLTKRIAAPMVGGMITSAALTLIVIPAIYSLWREWQLDRAARLVVTLS